MSSINTKTNSDVYAAFNKLNQDAATNDASKSALVKDDAAALSQAIETDGDLSATDKTSLLQQTAALLPMAGEAGHAAEWNEDMQNLINQIAALPGATDPVSPSVAQASKALDQTTTQAAATGDVSTSTTDKDVFKAYNTLNAAAGTNDTSKTSEIKADAAKLLSTIQADTTLSTETRATLTSQIQNLVNIAGVPGHGAEWNAGMQALVNSLSAIAQQSSTGTSTTTGPDTTSATSANAGSTVVPTSTDNKALTDTSLYPGGNGPELDDIVQGSLNDCTIDASLSSLVQNDPSAITDMISKNSNGTYNVTLFPNGVKQTVTVDPSKDLVANGTKGSDGKADWASYIEAAAVKVGFKLDASTGAEPADAIELLTGTGGNRGTATATSDYGTVSGLESALSSKLQSGKIVIAGWNVSLVKTDNDGNAVLDKNGSTIPLDPAPDTTTTVDGQTIEANHAYSVLGVKDGEVTLRNPWGGDNDGIVKMSVREYAQLFGSTYVAD